MNYTCISYEVADGVGRITMRRPEALNAINETTLHELKDAATRATADASLDVVVITGEGRAFVAGADIKAMVHFGAEEAEAFARLGQGVMDAIAAIPCPTIAAVNGFALGGGMELALACDLIYASDKARLGLPEVGLSVIPGWGGTQRLGRIAGWQVAREMIFTGRQVKADEAKALGVVLDVFPLDEFYTRIDQVVANIRRNGPLALRAAKAAINGGHGVGLREGLDNEMRAFSNLFGSDDQKEGMLAFIEGRPANFTRN